MNISRRALMIFGVLCSFAVRAEIVTVDCGGFIYRIDYDNKRVARRGAEGRFDESFAAQITDSHVRFRETFSGSNLAYDVVMDRTTGTIFRDGKIQGVCQAAARKF